MKKEASFKLCKNFVIYAFRNLINGKVYIGRTSQGIEQRFAEHMSNLDNGFKGSTLYVALAKYGLQNFELEILFHAFSKSYLDELEIEFIKEYDSYRNGYNMTPGGLTPILTDEVRAKIAKSLTGKKRTYSSPEAANWAYRMWETRRKRMAENPNCYKDMREVVKKGKDHPQAQRYLVRFPDGTKHVIIGKGGFAREHGFNYRYFSDTLKYKNRSCKGYKILAKLAPEKPKAKLLQGSTTIPQGSRVKRPETVPILWWLLQGNDIVSSAWKHAASERVQSE